MKMITELEEEMKKYGQDSDSEPEKEQIPDYDYKPIGLDKEKIQIRKPIIHRAIKKPKRNPDLNITRTKIKAPKYSSDNSSTLKNFSPKIVKKNDAATSTHIECSNAPDMLSFQIVNNSPTFDGKPNEFYIGQSSPWSRSPNG